MHVSQPISLKHFATETVTSQKLRDTWNDFAETSLASICTNAGDCSSVKYSNCTENAEWGALLYCQCIGEVAYAETLGFITLKSLTVSCSKREYSIWKRVGLGWACKPVKSRGS